MKIQITEERECCAPQDLLKYNGKPTKQDIKFCKYCGQLFEKRAYTDSAGDRDYDYEKIDFIIKE